MQSSQRTVRMPNGEIALATEIKSSEKAHIRCWNCKTHLIYDKKEETVKCAVCGNLNGTNNSAASSQFVVFRCNHCNTQLKSPISHKKVCCSHCGVISVLGRELLK